jgi:CubicO group peptidase (beta-lactamase class C family)
MTAIAERTLTSDLHDLVTSELARWKVPGMSIATWKDGEVQTAAFGLANTETGQPVTPGTVFQIGSITKTFTATAIMQLVERWKLELDQPVARYLPGFRLGDADATEALTVRHLLTHTGGFWGDDFTDYGIGDDALQKAVDALSGIRHLTRPGELWFYCNAGFQVLGRLIEQATHKPYEDVIRDRIFKPLEMERSTFWAHEAITYPVAVGYNTITTDEPETARPYAITRAMAAAGTIIGTPTDLLKFAAFHLGDGMANGKRLLSKSTLAAMQRPHVPAANMAPTGGSAGGSRMPRASRRSGTAVRRTATARSSRSARNSGSRSPSSRTEAMAPPPTAASSDSASNTTQASGGSTHQSCPSRPMTWRSTRGPTATRAVKSWSAVKLAGSRSTSPQGTR